MAPLNSSYKIGKLIRVQSSKNNIKMSIANPTRRGVLTGLLAGAGLAGCATQTSILAPSEPKNTPVGAPTLEDLLFQDIAFTAQDLQTHYDVNITPEELVYLTRAIYHEGSDPKALVPTGKTRWDEELKKYVPIKQFDLSQLQDSYRRIAHIFNNRHLFDTCSPRFENLTGESQFSQNGTFESILRECESVDDNGKPNNCQFSCTHFHYQDFQTAIEDGEYTLTTGEINEDRAFLAYKALLEVLTGEHQDPTGRALWYKNGKLANKQRGKSIVWNNREAFATQTTDCSEMQHIPSESIAQRITQGDPKITCRADQSFSMQFTGKFLSHNYYTLKARKKVEWLYDSANHSGHTYKNGEWKPAKSFSKKRPEHLRK